MSHHCSILSNWIIAWSFQIESSCLINKTVRTETDHQFSGSILSNWIIMPYPQDGECPFKGLHWPKQWHLQKKVTSEKFHLLDECHRHDLIEYFYKRDSKITTQHPQPPYEFPLIRFKGYFGRHSADIRKAVLGSEEYMPANCVAIAAAPSTGGVKHNLE